MLVAFLCVTGAHLRVHLWQLEASEAADPNSVQQKVKPAYILLFPHYLLT